MSVKHFAWISLSIGLLSAAPVSAQSDLLQQFKRQQELLAQKMESDVNTTLTLAKRLEATNPAEAVSLLNKTHARLEKDRYLTDRRKAALVRRVLIALRSAQVAAQRNSINKTTNPKVGRAQKNKEVDIRKRADNERVRKVLTHIQVLQKDGRTADAARLAQGLVRDYPNQLAAMGAGRIQTANDVIKNLRKLRFEADRRVLAVYAGIDRSAMLPRGDIEFPNDWQRKLKRTSLNGPPLTSKEKAILKALNSSISVNFQNSPLEDAVEYIATKLDLPILLDRTSLEEARVTTETPVSLNIRNASARTIFRKILGDLGLTYVVKDETIQVLSLDRASRMMITKTYYVGDLLQGGMFTQAGVRFVPWVDQFQAMQNVMSIMQIIQSIDPQSWRSNGGPGTISFHAPTMSIIVRQTAEIHNRLGSSLR